MYQQPLNPQQQVIAMPPQALYSPPLASAPAQQPQPAGDPDVGDAK